jgi:hypothetical protein
MVICVLTAENMKILLWCVMLRSLVDYRLIINVLVQLFFLHLQGTADDSGSRCLVNVDLIYQTTQHHIPKIIALYDNSLAAAFVFFRI